MRAYGTSGTDPPGCTGSGLVISGRLAQFAGRGPALGDAPLKSSQPVTGVGGRTTRRRDRGLRARNGAGTRFAFGSRLGSPASVGDPQQAFGRLRRTPAFVGRRGPLPPGINGGAGRIGGLASTVEPARLDCLEDRQPALFRRVHGRRPDSLL